MSEMIERVARAICVSRGFNPDAQAGPVYEASTGEMIPFGKQVPAWAEFGQDAVAAIETMREPTRPMVCSGDGQDPGFGSLSAKVWRAMIDEALKP